MEREIYFKKFLEDTKNTKLKRKIHTVISSLENGKNLLYFTYLKALVIDASTDVDFSSATCTVEGLGLQNEAFLAAIGCFFSTGCKVLKDFCADDPVIPLDENLQRSLSCLLQFLSRDNSVLLQREEEKSETVLARRYAEHLLMPLVDGKSYVIDAYPEAKCCDIEHPMSGICGDTSIGVQGGWHGKIDILIMGKNDRLPIYVGKPINDDLSESSIETKSDKISYTEIMAETIVFSFLQHKQNFGKLKNNLMPGIGIDEESLIVFMYDCDNDVLLGSPALDLFLDENISVSTVIVLWLVLNYRVFCNGLIDNTEHIKSNIHYLLGKENLQRYKTGVSMPFYEKITKRKAFDPNVCRPLDPETVLDDYPDCPYKQRKLYKQ